MPPNSGVLLLITGCKRIMESSLSLKCQQNSLKNTAPIKLKVPWHEGRLTWRIWFHESPPTRRKLERSIWRNGDRRRSPRVSAKVDDTDETGGGHQKGGGSPSKSRARKRKFNQNEVEATRDGNKQHHEDQLTTCGKFMKLPEKRILELILDTLQRRDVHEIFAEPVDPEEVEDYYEIIETPMDFGTMRAKLHEGMYQNLEQFEHDAFLIPKNAMHFNSSSSIYYKQARGIHELAEKLFHVLKTDPERFELEFPRERRRLVTRAMGKTKSVDFLMGNINQGSKYSDSGLMVSKKIQGRQRSNVDADLSTGGRETRKFQSFEENRRSTYEFWRPSFNNITSSVGAKIYTEPKQLNPINHQEIDYSKSLMSFVKDLGPTAQAIAKKKLQQWPQNSWNKTSVIGTLERNSVFSTTIGRIPSWKNPDAILGSSSHTVLNKKRTTLCDPVSAKDQEGASSSKKIQRGRGVSTGTNGEENGQFNNKNNDMKIADLTSSKKDNPCMKNSLKNKRTGIDLKEIKRSNAGDLNSISVEKKKLSTGNRFTEGKANDARRSDNSVLLPIVLALEHPHQDHAYDQMKPRDKKNATDQSSTVWQSNSKETSSFYNSEARAVKPSDEGVKKNKHPELKTFADLAPSSFNFATPFFNQARLTNNRINGHCQAGLGMDAFSRLRFQGAVDTDRGRQEEASGSKPFQLYDGLNNQLPWPPRNPPGTDFPSFCSPWRGFVLNGNIF